ncbi:MAG: class I SAM-dependent methyltransferase [Lachnospiraceae bacterium]|nr:class I SAM-dependent methyltransferase [Lachnospiraceae bacterium]
MKLSKRLETIVSMVPETAKNGCVADVGTDHGFVPIRLIELGKAARALAMDVRKGPLERAREHIMQYGMEDRIESRLSDGLQALQPGEAQTVVIAGMGGELMLRILRDGAQVREQVEHWILSPQSELSLFRHGLEELGLAIVRETMVEEDGKYYTIMEVRPGAMHYEQEYAYRYGACLIAAHSPVLKEFLEKEMRQYQAILEKLDGQDGEGARVRHEELKEEWKQMEGAYHAMQ